ncbi:MAG: class I SAM-dependent methyltransferase [Phycisphaerales bacterium]
MAQTINARPSTGKPAATRGNKDQGAPKGSTRGFLLAFLKKPTQVGAVLPSSDRLCRMMCEGIGLEKAAAVIEYGPGTGVVTRHILERVGSHTKLFAIEIERPMAEDLRGRFPGLCVKVGSVADVERFCREEGVGTLADGGGVDVIVSGLPWASFPESLQRNILEATMRVLKPGGLLVTFAYQIGRLTPAGRRFAKLLPEYFTTVTRTRLVWRNVPPAYVLQCRR